MLPTANRVMREEERTEALLEEENVGKVRSGKK